jgi:hypothetical protein
MSIGRATHAVRRAEPPPLPSTNSLQAVHAGPRAPDRPKRDAPHPAHTCMDGLHDRLPAHLCGFLGSLESCQHQMVGIPMVVLLLLTPARPAHGGLLPHQHAWEVPT